MNTLTNQRVETYAILVGDVVVCTIQTEQRIAMKNWCRENQHVLTRLTDKPLRLQLANGRTGFKHFTSMPYMRSGWVDSNCVRQIYFHEVYAKQ